MEHNVFRDYCKAENSDDEEVNCDLQSRLYAAVYYGSNNLEDLDVKENIKLEDSGFDSKESNKSISTQVSNFDGNFKFNFSLNTESESSNVHNKHNLNVPSREALQHPQESIKSPKGNKESVVSHKQESINSNPANTYDTSKNIKPETEAETKEEPTQCSNFETRQSSLNSKQCNINDNTGRTEEEMCVKQKVNNPDNIFRKYEFSKLFINKLYQEKYENLNKRLQQLEEKEKEQTEEDVQDEKNMEEENQQQLSYLDPIEKETRYEICTRSDKIQKVSNYSEEVAVLSVEMDSDSEESILEVPIPPKPLPPVIQLPDSDDEFDMSSSNRNEQFYINNICNLTEDYENITYIRTKASNNVSTTIDDTLASCATEDITLNCTEIQKAASSIKEIMEMSKNVQNDLTHSHKDKNASKDTFTLTTESLKTAGETVKSSSNTEKNIASEFQSPLDNINNSNIVYERDKPKLVTFAEEVEVMTFRNPNELTISKRRRDEDNEPNINAKRKKTNNSKHSEANATPQQSKEKEKQQSWVDYFFRPMSESLKNFYNEVRGQENFDIQEIQSKMSKDPRLWAILDEDLMPTHSRRNRFWNVKCNKCQCEGHRAYNCTQPHKPPRCYMCGTEGHIEARCPQKMCLTCGKKQGTFRKTCESCRTLYCNMCKAVGHRSTECPDLWRRFHQTTRNSEINIPENLSEIMKPADLLYCCNCTKRGHDSSMCYEYRWSQHFPTPASVSNYGDRTQSAEHGYDNTTKDVIPLTKSKKNKHTRIKNAEFSAETDEGLEGCCVLYSYGTFHTRKQNGEELTKKVPNDIVPNASSFVKSPVPVEFFDHLSKIINFELKIFFDPLRVLKIRIRSIMGVPVHLHQIFGFWLRLQDDEKNLHIDTNLPRGMKKMFNFLTTNLEELDRDLPDEANNLSSRIEKLKKSMAGVQDPNILSCKAGELLKLKKKLLKIYHTKPVWSREAVKLRKLAKLLSRKVANLTSQKVPDVPLPLYVQIITVYNKVTVPRTLTKDELSSFFSKFNKKKSKKNKGKENKVKKQNSQNCNKLKASTSSNVNNNAMLKNTQIQDKQPSATFTTTECSTSNNIQPDYNATQFYTDSEGNQLEKTIAGYYYAYPIEVLQLPRDQLPPNNAAEIPVRNPYTISPNLIPLPVKKPVCSNTLSKNAKNDQLNSTPCTEVRPIDKDVEIISNNSELTKISNPQQTVSVVNSETNASKKKKSKKAKLDSIGSQVRNVETSIEAKAKKVIIEALEFNLPYMNKAIEEVEKRMSDKNITHEHIDMLQRLINLEKDHRQYVTSVYSYLK
ncbi:uncharacterized protein LOC128877644 isoform X1 [Hylaeus volcanicus]|uniref:uncharacterized protein LOC128877644 isoform X1 n=1 Tax=Hylaeus volcanicus TaxID=313075 RepID=UPI0023B7DF5F|nr:uncharacterized protein LOC128877644 isoform X1 [Hylaeus volcanicus]